MCPYLIRIAEQYSNNTDDLHFDAERKKSTENNPQKLKRYFKKYSEFLCQF